MAWVNTWKEIFENWGFEVLIRLDLNPKSWMLNILFCIWKYYLEYDLSESTLKA